MQTFGQKSTHFGMISAISMISTSVGVQGHQIQHACDLNETFV
jgi:hypothetical protein